jgi:hypothetical protein
MIVPPMVFLLLQRKSMPTSNSPTVVAPHRTAGRWLKLAGHAAALVFGAFWLVATGSDDPIAYNCFTGLGNTATLSVPLGPPVAASDGGTAVSCQGLDGLVSPGTVTLSLSQGPRPNGEICYGYGTTTIQGTTDVALGPAPSEFVQSSFPNALTIASGTFSSSQETGCNGAWTFVLEPQQLLSREGPIISPLTASTSAPWLVVRTIDLAQAQLCGGVFVGQAGSLRCSDTFVVNAITQGAAP